MFLAALLISFLLCFPVYRLLERQGIVDRPNARSSHSTPTVRGGGLAIVITIALSALWVDARIGATPLVWFVGATVMLAVVSFFDDLKGVPAIVRFGTHALAAVIALHALGWPVLAIAVSPEWSFTLPFAISLLVGFLWLAGYTNAFNFMDGINGIAAGQAVLAATGYCVVACAAGAAWTDAPVLFSAAIAGAAAGFLPHNFPKARMFMGDVSSAPLGFLLAADALWIASTYGMWLLIPLALLNANFVLDTGITLARRILRGERWYDAHREHFYQRLTRAGRSHRFVTSWVIALQIGVVALMYFYVHASPAGRVWSTLAVAGCWLAFFLCCELQFRRSQTPALACGGEQAVT